MGVAAAALALYEPRDDEEMRALAVLAELAAKAAPFDRTLPLHLTGSAFVLDPAGRRVLLRFHDRLERWMQVGGHGDPGEGDPFEVARREAEEETGLRDLVAFGEGLPRPLQIVIVDVPAGRGEPAHRHGDLRYALATAEPEALRPERPSAPLRWCSIEEAVELSAEPNVAIGLLRCAALFEGGGPARAR